MERFVLLVMILLTGCATSDQIYRRALSNWHLERVDPVTFTVRHWVRPGAQIPTSHAEEIPAQKAEMACFKRQLASAGRPKETMAFVDSVAQCMRSQGWELIEGPLVVTS